MQRCSRAIQVVLFATLALVLVLGVTACGDTAEETPTPTQETTTDPAETPAATPAEDPAKQVVDTKCSLCHTLDRVYSADKTRDEWVTTVDRMKSNGLVISEDEYATVIDYLSAQ